MLLRKRKEEINHQDRKKKSLDFNERRIKDQDTLFTINMEIKTPPPPRDSDAESIALGDQAMN